MLLVRSGSVTSLDRALGIRAGGKKFPNLVAMAVGKVVVAMPPMTIRGMPIVAMEVCSSPFRIHMACRTTRGHMPQCGNMPRGEHTAENENKNGSEQRFHSRRTSGEGGEMDC